MFSEHLNKNNVNTLIKSKTKKLKNQKTTVNKLSVEEQINSFAEIIVNNLLKNCNHENENEYR